MDHDNLLKKEKTKCYENKRKAEEFCDKRNMNKKNRSGQVYQDTRGSTWCPACKFYKQKIHLCQINNLWINIDVVNKLVIVGDSIGDVKCTEEEDDNKNTVEYYKNKNELLESMETVASEHRKKSGKRKRKKKST